ncbi:MAG: Crp/Fnr family transcriptional regulator [Bacteroidetes bacterium]|jgi:CRP/FNR family transcriptional regulator|nr:Crp/Fnr family transcriptional regulator [Bacteroidota bacterium]
MAITQHDCITCSVRACSILNECDKETLKAISNFKLTKFLAKGKRLFSEGEPVEGVCFIKKGFLKVELNGKQDRPLILKIAGKGTVLGYRINAKHSVHTCSAIAVSDVQYCYVPYELFDKITSKSSELRHQVINLFIDELELVKKKALTLAHKTVREKVAESILLLAETFNCEKEENEIYINFCRQDIADLIGTTKEQVSKVIKDFEKEKLIKCTAKKFSYLDIFRLNEIAFPNVQ